MSAASYRKKPEPDATAGTISPGWTEELRQAIEKMNVFPMAMPRFRPQRPCCPGDPAGAPRRH